MPGYLAVRARAGSAERRLQLAAERLSVLAGVETAADVVADVDGHRRVGTGLKEGVEIGHAEGVGGRHLQLTAGVVHGSRADPAHPPLDGMEDGEEILPPVQVGRGCHAS